MPKKAIYVEEQRQLLVPFLANANAKLVGGLILKYAVPSDFHTKITANNLTYPGRVNVAQAKAQEAQEATGLMNTDANTVVKALFGAFSHIEKQSNLDETDMEALGARRVSTPPDLNTIKPEASETVIHPDMVIIEWFKRRMDGVRVFGSYDGNTYTTLGDDQKSPFEDTRPNRTPGTPEARYYKMRYLKNDKLVGVESDVISVVCNVQ